MKTNIVTYLVDDSRIDLLINQKVLSNYSKDLKTKAFQSPVDALEYFRSNLDQINNRSQDYKQIILIDVNMPVIKGFEFLNALIHLDNFKENVFNIYFLSSSINSEDINKAMSMNNCNGYLNKPLTKDLFKEILSRNETPHQCKA